MLFNVVKNAQHLLSLLTKLLGMLYMVLVCMQKLFIWQIL